MRKHILTVLITLCTSLFLVSFTAYVIKPKNVEVSNLEAKSIETIEIKIEPIEIEINQHDMFLDRQIGHRESSNRYDVVNGWGYMGKYQFGKRTLKALGYNVSKKEFLNSPYLQEQAMLDLLNHNKKILNNYIEYWDGKKINGKVITESGILLVQHTWRTR